MAKKPIEKREVAGYLSAIKPKHYAAIYRAAKKQGLRPFFRDPRDMIALREIMGK